MVGREQSEQLLQIVQDVGQLAANAGRADLASRMEQARQRLLDPAVRVIVVGEFKQGKSKLINALVNAPACPVDDDIATSVTTSVGYAPEPEAYVLVQEATEDAQKRVVRHAIPIEQIADFVSERGNPGNERGIVSAEVLLPRALLESGLKLVDSPGLGGLESPNALATLSALSSAHAVLFVSDASQEYTEPEIQLLRHAMRISPNVAAVLAKTDLYPSWREIEKINRGHLDKIGDVPLYSTSSDLRLLAGQMRDGTLNEESGFPGLITHLHDDVLAQAEEVHVRGAVHDLRSVVEQLRLSIQAELNAIEHPQETPQMIAQLEAAAARADEFRSRSSRWQVTLNDGIADLIGDMEHDLRERLRKAQREAENAIDAGDPGPIWDQFSEWLTQRVVTALSETFVWTDERSRWLADEVADLFGRDERMPLDDLTATDGVLDPVEDLTRLDPGHMGAAERIYIGMRGSYGGVLMVGLITGLVGLTLINPFSVLAGVLVGRRAYREDMSNRLLRRRAEAKALVRRYVDDVTFQVGKQLRDRLKFVQRGTRDHFGAIAEELHRSLMEAVNNAKQAASMYTAQRDQRAAQLRTDLGRLEGIEHGIPSLPALPPQAQLAAGRQQQGAEAGVATL